MAHNEYVPVWRHASHTIVFPLKDSSEVPQSSVSGIAAKVGSDLGFSTATNSVTEISDGYYSLLLTQLELDNSFVMVKVTGTGVVPHTEEIYPINRSQLNTAGHPIAYGGELLQSTATRITFMAVSQLTGYILPSLVTSYTLLYGKNDGTGTMNAVTSKGEYAEGWYYGDLTAAMTDTLGPLIINMWNTAKTELYASLYFIVVADAGGVDNDAIADAVWDEALSGHTTDGTAGQKLGLINTSQVTTASYLTGLTITFPRAVTFDETLSGLTIPSDWDVIYFTVKTAGAVPENDDERAMIQILETNGGDAGDGLQRLNGQDATADKAYGSLTIDQGEGTCQITITDEMLTLLAAATGLQWDLKYIDTSGDSGLIAQGTASIINTVTMALS